jgi:5'-deoxynucleotidase YfbR-like HD superfamily hydrolase
MDSMFIKRWTIVGTVVESNIASHSYNVAMLSMAILARMKYNHFKLMPHEVAYAALIHDLAEVYNGDVPSPAKREMEKMGINPDTLHPYYQAEAEVPEVIYMIVKTADLLDNYLFILNYGIGSRAAVALENCRHDLQQWNARLLADPRYEEIEEAAHEVFTYIEERGSESAEERNRIKGEIEAAKERT